MNRIELREKLEKKLSPKRFEHSLGVEYTAACMAMCYDVDIEKAAVAGLLHDCAKYLSTEKKIKLCRENQLSISEYEYANPELLHGKLGAFYAKKKYGVEDPEILSAITYHTTGKEDMTTLEKIIYIADFMEANRKEIKNMGLIRKMAFTNLDACLCQIMKNTIHYLEVKNAVIDDITLSAYEYYKNSLKVEKEDDL